MPQQKAKTNFQQNHTQHQTEPNHALTMCNFHQTSGQTPVSKDFLA